MILLSKIDHQAYKLAEEAARDPFVSDVFWFPHDEEIRLIEVGDDIPRAGSDDIEPFYFDPSPEDGIDFSSAIALIHSEGVGKLNVPEGWVSWKDAIILINRKK